MNEPLEFERPIYELEQQILDLEIKSKEQDGVNFAPEIKKLQSKLTELLNRTYENLNPWQQVQLSRHPQRPHAKKIILSLCPDFHELHGDRCHSNDAAIFAGLGNLNKIPVIFIGIEKGINTKEKILHNFGMPKPEGYRKALRLMKLADQFNIPIITFVDTPGAYPGIQAEERGQGQAIAENLAQMFDLSVPIISVVIGEGGSGGALALAVADKVFMMQYSIYSVISPESCASILWSDASMASTAAESLQLNALKALELGVIDEIIPEALGGAHRDHNKSIKILKVFLDQELKKLLQLKRADLKNQRFEKFRLMGNKTLSTEQSLG